LTQRRAKKFDQPSDIRTNTHERLPEAALDQLFRDARSLNKWQDRDVPDALLHEIVDLQKYGPTSANCSPARFLFVKSREAKERLKPLLSEGNREKTMRAPVCAIIGYDLDFYEHLPQLYPHTDARSWFTGKEEKIR
jgi:3-hydroxypropanoate dehydrogenase